MDELKSSGRELVQPRILVEAPSYAAEGLVCFAC